MRLVSLSPAVTEILFALKKENLLVARDQFSNFPEEVKAVPKIAGHQKIDIATLQSHMPDLVFTSTVIQQKTCGGNQNCADAVHTSGSAVTS